MGITFLHRDSSKINYTQASINHPNTQDKTQHIFSIHMDQTLLKSLSSTLKAEKSLCIEELLEENFFYVRDFESSVQPPYHLSLSCQDNRLHITIYDHATRKKSFNIMFSLKALRRHIKDYFIICESYYDAMKHNLGRMEALDMGRKALHDEAGELIIKALSDTVEMDLATARRLFTLICLLQLRQYRNTSI